MIVILTLLTLLSASLHIHAEYTGARFRVWIFKPLTMVFILLVAVRPGQSDASTYKYAIIAGLICSLVGDIFLMLPSDRFIAGLVSFLVTHIFYIRAFTSGVGFGFSLSFLVPFVIYGVFLFSILWPHLGRMKLPVLMYAIVILVMAWQAGERWQQLGQSLNFLAFIGAIMFLISDSVLAINRFRGQFKSAQALILSAYYSAQWLIALSVKQGLIIN